MANEPGLGAAERYLSGRGRQPAGRRPDSALNDRHASPRSSPGCRKPVPGLRRLLRLFVELAAVHHRGRRGARSHSGKIRQRKTVGNALRRRPLFGAGRQDRRGDLMWNLRNAARSLPDLHARRCRMRHGATPAWVSGVGVIFQRVVAAFAREDGWEAARSANQAVAARATSSSSGPSSTCANVLSGLVDSVIGLRLEDDEVTRVAGVSRDSA